ncbi:hypothetical protein [Microbacterium sp.]|uniref:hypothetical protein n=1 Tax=Microbacterium sp. TaxID=51671 RepID=UPI003A95BAAB
MRRGSRVWIALGVGAAVAVGLSMLQLPVVYTSGWGLLVAAGALLFGIRLADDPRGDAPGRERGAEYTGSEVSRLAWAINLRTGTANEAVVRRVRATLRRRLLRHGVDVDDEQQAPRIDELIGTGLWTRLNGRRTRVSDLREALAAAERLAPASDSPHRENEQ